MQKVLVYVDAENISYAECKQELQNLYGVRQEGFCVIGKVYGNSGVLSADLLQTCFEYGLDYVDTGKITNSHKNVADMKIVTDCAFDAMIGYAEGVSAVYVLTKDNDFLPLVQKLRSLQIEVFLPLYVAPTVEELPCIESVLVESNWNPRVQMGALSHPYNDVLRVVGCEREREVSLYFRRKISRLATAMADTVGTDQVAQLMTIPVEKFSLGDVMQSAGITKQDFSEEAVCVLNTYMARMFGFAYTRTDALKKLKEFYLEN